MASQGDGAVSSVKARVKKIFESCEKIDVSNVEKNRVAFGLIQLEAFADIFYEMGKQHNKLTWEDMLNIHKYIKDAMNYHLYELQNGIEGQKKVYQNVLGRFLKEKKED